MSTLNDSVIKKVISMETNELTVDYDHLGEFFQSLALRLLIQLFSNLNIDIERGDHLVMDWCVQSGEQLTFLFLELKFLVDSDINEGQQLAVLVIEVDFAAPNSELYILLRLTESRIMPQIVWKLYVRLLTSCIKCVPLKYVFQWYESATIDRRLPSLDLSVDWFP